MRLPSERFGLVTHLSSLNRTKKEPLYLRATKYTPRLTTTKTSAYPAASQQGTLVTAASADSLTSLAATLTIWGADNIIAFPPKPIFGNDRDQEGSFGVTAKAKPVGLP
ncbi:MAG TPA: hypothetical protein VF020_12830 [Chthoniobacterales bacterium]